MHHSDENPFKNPAELRSMFPTAAKIGELATQDGPPPGPTGQHPAGVLTPCDKGGIEFSLAHADGTVVIIFGTPVQWVGLDPGQAIALGEGLIEHARQARILEQRTNE